MEASMASELGDARTVDERPFPPGLLASASLGPRETRVYDHKIAVRSHWWDNELKAHGFADETFTAADSVLTRRDLFELGSRASDDAGAARRLLWATLAWGTGERHRNNRARIASLAVDPDGIGKKLAGAAALARNDAEAAYRAMMPGGRNLVAYLGPPFFTKFLYFAGAGDPAHPCLILDSVVAEALARLEGASAWELPGRRYWWPSSTYVEYTRLLHRWAREVSDARHESIAADQLERWLFSPASER